MKNNLVFKITAWWAGLYQLALGVTGVFASRELATTVIQKTYGASIDMTPQVFYLVKFCSAYMVAFGVAMVMLALNPVKYKNLMWVAITLFSVRIIERLMFTELLGTSFGISVREEMFTSGVLLLMIVLLYYFRPKDK